MSDAEYGRPLLVVDDDKKLCGLIREYLEPLGYRVSMRHTGPDGLQAALEGSYEAVILDVMMPGMDGIEVLRELRKKSTVPVLMLTAMGEESDRIAGLEMGADDYLPKTFSTRELLARLRAVMRHAHRDEVKSTENPGEFLIGDLCLKEGSHVATRGGELLDLTALEFAILGSLMRTGGRVKSREELIEEVSKRKFDVFDRSIDVHISALRRKLGDDAKAPNYIRTIRAVGYQLICGEEEQG